MRWMALQTGVFLLSMSLVVCAGSVLTFLLAWELMAVSSWFLVITEHDRPETVRGGLWYLAMTHMGLVALLASVLPARPRRVVGVDVRGAARRHRNSLAPGTRNAIFLLALVGFGSKAGLVPVHVWLPRAHPAAPSHVSALMSAVMVKLGLYGLLRVGLDLLGGGPSWWGVVLVAIGAATALTGVLYALVDDDLKRLLAYSTVENVGLMVLGAGAGFLFLSLAQPEAAALAFGAALLHAVNHAAFKGVLFLGAGSVLHATGLRDMNRLGGLIKRAPWTAASFLVGSLAIAALPPFNGFVSEWLLFQSFLPGVASSRASIAVLLTLGVGALALTGGLAAATFVKAFGVSFLAMPRSEEAANAHEAGWPMRIGMAVLALGCPVLAVLTVPVLSAISGALAGLGGLPAASTTFHLGVTLETPQALARISPVAPHGRARDRHGRCVARRAPALAKHAEGRRHLGLRPDRPDVEDGVHVDGLRRTPAPHLRRTLPAHRRPHGDGAAGFAVPHPRHFVPHPTASLVRARAVRPALPCDDDGGGKGPGAAVGIDQRLPDLHRAGADSAAGHGHRILGDDVFDMAGIAVEIGQALLALALAPALVGFIRWLKARLQNRRGAPIWQPYAELRKLFRKDMVVSRHASWIFHLAPYAILGSTVVVSLLVPVLVTPLPFNAVADLFAVVYLLLLGTVFLALAGLDPASAFGGMGSSREMTIAAISEPAIALSHSVAGAGRGIDQSW